MDFLQTLYYLFILKYINVNSSLTLASIQRGIAIEHRAQYIIVKYLYILLFYLQ